MLGKLLVVALVLAAAGPAGLRAAEVEGDEDGVHARQPRAQAVDASRWQADLRRELRPVARARDGLLRALRRKRGAGLWPECKALGRALDGVDEASLTPPPSLAVGYHLRQALSSLRGAVAGCADRRYFGMTWRLERAEHSFGEMALALSRHRSRREQRLIILRP